MALASATPDTFKLMHLTPVTVRVEYTTAADCVIIPESKGIIAVQGTSFPKGTSASALATAYTPVYGYLLVSTASYTAASTSITYDSATCKDRVVPYYVMTNAGEVMEVTADDGAHTVAGTLTVRRGCLGTTAAAGGAATGGVQDNAPLTVLNSFVGATAGFALIYGLELPNDPNTKLFE